MSRQKLLRNAEVSIGEWRRWRMTAELETGVSHVLELAMHLKRSAELAARDAAAVAQDAAPDAVHRADLGAHRDDKQAVEAERTAGTFVEFSRQRAHEARETPVRVATTAAVFKASTDIGGPIALILRLSGSA